MIFRAGSWPVVWVCQRTHVDLLPTKIQIHSHILNTQMIRSHYVGEEMSAISGTNGRKVINDDPDSSDSSSNSSFDGFRSTFDYSKQLYELYSARRELIALVAPNGKKSPANSKL